MGRHFISGDFLGIPASLLFFLIKGCLGIFTRFHNEDLADFLIGDLAIFFGMVNLGLDLGGVLGILAGLLSGCSLSIGVTQYPGRDLVGHLIRDLCLTGSLDPVTGMTAQGGHVF